MQSNQLIDNEQALRLFFEEEIYLIKGEQLPEDLIRPTTISIPLATETASTTNNPAPIQPDPNSDSTKTEVTNINPPNSKTTISEPIDTKAAISFEYKGKNEKRILILTEGMGTEASSPEGRELLRKICKAVNLSATDFAVVYMNKYPDTSFAELQTFFDCQIMLAFGISAVQLKIESTDFYQIQQIGQTKLILSHALQEMADNDSYKRQLWNKLQQLFK